MNIDKSLKFVSINIGLITISDTRTLENDKSGNLLNERIINFGHKIEIRKIIKDDIEIIKNTISDLTKNKNIDAIITTGGTGLTGRDSTPEAVIVLSEKIIDGFGELFRQISYEKIGTSTIQSRAIAGLANHTYIFSLPGSPNACKDGWDQILQYQLDIRHKPCNFIEIMPRLKEK
ncbi:MAG: Molybdenum cofactor biosynthesis protein B [Alphaproteobacteria bacterium MarineAlpha5_Bin8]|nr:MAG: Molybdenum cofactor biosynthesis protein B [Alphaproteobacteria bacterium MarineAlpha5_Bin7]PPR48138.1 MAG: Molybdenum cofactor biosynthesis protein B [Alphaproteobacteria bacterium MarineAlpha5_Bin8]PPR53425.1 MAG: Molybdenum cofactor biosynthesis protein B [Alphaproteobacteria bacterium MarineAlpha5_Bin6]|tara:strand:+ start:1149 stop:1676 length:528 start_codon:yes stop_codon:yes gene_type:complete